MNLQGRRAVRDEGPLHAWRNRGSHGPYYARFNAWKQALLQGKPAPIVTGGQ
jgi:hypothetical protein